MPLLAADPRVSRLTVFVPDDVRGVVHDVDVRSWNPRDARRGYAALIHDVAALAPDVVFVPTARHVAFGSVPVVTMVRNMEPLAVPFGGNTLREGSAKMSDRTGGVLGRSLLGLREITNRSLACARLFGATPRVPSASSR